MDPFPMTVLLATDGSEEAELAAEMAAGIAKRTESELHLVCVVDLGVAADPRLQEGLRQRARSTRGSGEKDEESRRRHRRNSPVRRANGSGDSNPGRKGRGWSHRHRQPRTWRGKEGTDRKRLRLGGPPRPLPCVGGAWVEN
jgi:hypothetical protein